MATTPFVAAAAAATRRTPLAIAMHIAPAVIPAAVAIEIRAPHINSAAVVIASVHVTHTAGKRCY
jgi:hypothetical protein